MELDREKLNRLLSMNDAQLRALIQKLAAESGISPESLGINPDKIQDLRIALSGASDDDLKNLMDRYKASRGK